MAINGEESGDGDLTGAAVTAIETTTIAQAKMEPKSVRGEREDLLRAEEHLELLEKREIRWVSTFALHIRLATSPKSTTRKGTNTQGPAAT